MNNAKAYCLNDKLHFYTFLSILDCKIMIITLSIIKQLVSLLVKKTFYPLENADKIFLSYLNFILEESENNRGKKKGENVNKIPPKK